MRKTDVKRAVMLLALASCGVDLEVPDDVVVACAVDADCQGGKVCAPLIGRCVDTIDGDAPRVLLADTPAADRVRVVYSEPVSCAAALDIANYVIVPPLELTFVGGAACDGEDAFTTEAVLFTDLQTPQLAYTVTVGAVVDSGGNPLVETARSAAFPGFGQAPDASPPPQLAPAHESRVLGAVQSLVWAARPGVETYFVDVATDAAFSAPVPGSPFTIVAPEASLLLTGLTDVTYFWRVRSNLTPADTTLTVRSFDVLIDTVYVHCASEPCDTGVRNGSRTRPYGGVQRALAAAAELSTSQEVATPTIKIAARGPGAPYIGPVILQWQSVRIEGGWDASFVVHADDATQTVLTAPGPVMLVSNLPGAVSASIEGVTLSTPSNIDATTLTISAASNSLSFRNVIVQGHSNGRGKTLHVSGGPATGPRFESCTFTMAAEDDRDVQVAVVANAAPSFTTCAFQFLSGVPQAAVAVQVDGPLPGDAVFDRCDIAGGTAAAIDGHSSGLQVTMAGTSDGRVTVQRSTVTSAGADVSNAVALARNARVLLESSLVASSDAVTNADAVAEGILTEDRSEVIVRNSVLAAAQATNALALRAAKSSRLEITSSLLLARATSADNAAALAVYETHPILTNNIFATADATMPCVDVQLGSLSAMAAAMHNNVFLNCDGYRTGNSFGAITALTTAEINALDGAEITDDGCIAPACPNARFSGNVVLAEIFDNVFVDWDGNDDDSSTIADNDYHLQEGADPALTEGGLESTANVCAPQGETVACNVPLVDIDGEPRDAPYSVGPDEVIFD